MKRLSYYLWILSLLAGFCWGCQEEEDLHSDAAVSGEYWESLSGVYRGKMVAQVEGIVVDTFFQQLFIQSDNRNRMTLSMKSLVITNEIEQGTIFFRDLCLDEQGDEVRIWGETMQAFGPVANARLLLTGTIQGSLLKCRIDVQSNTARAISMDMQASWLPVPLNGDATVKKMTLYHPFVISQPDISGSRIRFYVSEDFNITDSSELFIRPRFELAKGAAISYPDSLMNFARKDVSYTVVAEDSISFTRYRVELLSASIVTYNINDWRDYYGYMDPTGKWASNNGFFHALKTEGKYDGAYPVVRVKGSGVANSAAQMTTVSVGSGNDFRIYAGSFFTGKFDRTMAAPLLGPVYGDFFADKPIKVKGTYKYVPGRDYYMNDSLVPEMSDTCRITAILYEAPKDESTLSMADYLKDPKVIAVADLGTIGGMLRPNFSEFNIYFNYAKPFFVTKRYKIALICSPSKNADVYRGSVGSVLTVSDIEVMYNRSVSDNSL